MTGHDPGEVHAAAGGADEADSGVEAPDVSDEELGAALPAICETLRERTGHDFRAYKRGTMLRRLRRRVQARRAATAGDYARVLADDPEEPGLLVRDLLIGVTSFFRDPEAFDALVTEALALVVAAGDAGAPLRIWVAGCGSGEEAYSIAILVRESLLRAGRPRAAQIFATDIDEAQIARARRGRFRAEHVEEAVSPERVRRFFVRDGGDYLVGPELRDLCIFSAHSLIRDPPFSSLDLISCRNVLIYLEPALQGRLVPLFHYALRAGGFLFLGPSEGLSSCQELFTVIDKKHRLFRRNDAMTRPPVDLPLAGTPSPASTIAPSAWPAPVRRARPSVPGSDGLDRIDPAGGRLQAAAGSAFERMILDEYAPASVVVNERGDILYAAGRTGLYLQATAGAPTNNVLELAQGHLGSELRAALFKAARTGGKVVRDGIVHEVDGEPRRLRLTVRTLPGAPPEAGLFAVILQETGATRGDLAEAAAASGEGSGRQLVEELADALRSTRSELQAALEDLSAANEELHASNEELSSTNEELQSANEELSTSQEELRSVNEELETTNAELREKVLALAAVNADLENLFNATRIATVFLDRELHIRRFSPAAAELLHLRPADVTRPLAELAHPFPGHDLMEYATEVLRTREPMERLVRTAAGAWFILRVLPYRSAEQAVAGVVAKFVDVTAMKRAEEALRRSEAQLRRQTELLEHAPVLVREADDRIVMWNAGMQKLYGYSREEAIGRVSHELLATEFTTPMEEIRAALARDGRWEGELSHRRRDGARVMVSSLWMRHRGEAGDGEDRDAIIEVNTDVTERKRVEEAVREADRRKNEFLGMLSHELRNPLAPIRNSLYILDRTEPGSEAARRAKAVIDRQVSQMTRIIDDLLDVTRISRGKVQLVKARMELGEVVRRTVEDQRSLFATAGVHLAERCAPEAMWVDGDAVRVAQAVANLLQNAAKFTRRGGHVAVSLQGDMGADGRRAVIRVRDDGVGIDPGLLARLFRPFEQADSSLDRSMGGLGLGLALVKGLVELHGGDVTARSDGPGRGAEFEIRLPLIASPAVEAQAASSAADAVRPRRVLLVEDHEDVADTLREMLELDAHVVEVASSGTAGVEAARRFRPDVILCDIGLPGMDGYEVARAIRADDALRGVHLVALSGYTSPEHLARAREAGFDRHIAKPLSIEKLEAALAAAPRAGGPGRA